MCRFIKEICRQRCLMYISKTLSGVTGAPSFLSGPLCMLWASGYAHFCGGCYGCFWCQVGSKMEPSKGLVGAKLGQVGSLGGGLGAMLGSKIGLGSPLGRVLGPSWAQEPIKTPKGEAQEPIKTPKSEEMGLQEPPRASLGPPNLEPKSNINQHKKNMIIF